MTTIAKIANVDRRNRRRRARRAKARHAAKMVVLVGNNYRDRDVTWMAPAFSVLNPAFPW